MDRATGNNKNNTSVPITSALSIHWSTNSKATNLYLPQITTTNFHTFNPLLHLHLLQTVCNFVPNQEKSNIYRNKWIKLEKDSTLPGRQQVCVSMFVCTFTTRGSANFESVQRNDKMVNKCLRLVSLLVCVFTHKPGKTFTVETSMDNKYRIHKYFLCYKQSCIKLDHININCNTTDGWNGKNSENRSRTDYCSTMNFNS